MIEVSAATARRFILGKQGLWPGRRWRGKAGTATAVTATEHLQLDPLVIVGRSHDLMLHARVSNYRPAMFDQLAYSDRRFFDWGGWLAVRPMTELPYWRVLMQRDRAHERQRRVAKQYSRAIAEMRTLLQQRKTVSGRDFAAQERQAVASYRGSKDSSVALYYLWRVGEAMTHHRDGFERVYAASEAVAPSELLIHATAADTDRFMVRKQIAFAGIGRAESPSKTLGRKMKPGEMRAIEEDLVERGEIEAVAVPGWRGSHFVLAEDVAALELIDRGGVPRQWRPRGATSLEEVALLSPLDPVSARGRAKALFDFDYVWEIYKRPDDVKYGRYTMPVLWGDQLIGRVDPRLDRATSTLVVNGFWLEDGVRASNDLRDAVAAGLARFMAALGAERVDASTLANARLRATLNALRPAP